MARIAEVFDRHDQWSRFEGEGTVAEVATAAARKHYMQSDKFDCGCSGCGAEEFNINVRDTETLDVYKIKASVSAMITVSLSQMRGPEEPTEPKRTWLEWFFKLPPAVC